MIDIHVIGGALEMAPINFGMPAEIKGTLNV